MAIERFITLNPQNKLSAAIEEAKTSQKANSKEVDRLRQAYEHAQATHQRWFQAYRAAGERSMKHAMTY